MSSLTITIEAGTINLSPFGFRKWAADYLLAFRAFPLEGEFSAVPFFLCCRSIELSLKALHLESKSQKEVKRLYSHDLLKAYEDLDGGQQCLSPTELVVLKAANEIYVRKEFEYFNGVHAMTGYGSYPDIVALAELAE